MVIDVRRRAVGVFPHHRNAEQALHELKNSGFPMERVSVIAKDANHTRDLAGTEVKEKVGNKADEGAKVGALSGGALGGLTGLLIGLGSLAIPGVGPIMLAGATATALATTLAGAGIGAAAGGLIGALIGLGIPEERARVYNERVQRGDYLIIIDGTEAEIERARAILHRWGIEEFEVYDAPGSQQVASDVVHSDVHHQRHAIGYFSLLHDAEAAINELRNVGFPLSQISLINRERPQRSSFAGVHVSDRFDPITLGLPDQRSQFYHQRIHLGDYIVIVSGTKAEIHQAEAILKRSGIHDFALLDGHDLARPTLETPVKTTETVPTNYTNEPSVVIIDRREGVI
jgi:uncharacterized membrane protein